MMNPNIPEIEVSVFCLCYNHSKYIRKTLEGFVSQKTNFRYEIIVHDDASTDDSQNIIKEYANKHPSFMKDIFQENNQYSQGVNILDDIIYPRMKGKCIAICEGDDYWDNLNKLQCQYDILEEYPECSICTHKVICCNENESINERVIPKRYYKINSSGIIDKERLAELYWLQ